MLESELSVSYKNTDLFDSADPTVIVTSAFWCHNGYIKNHSNYFYIIVFQIHIGNYVCFDLQF